MKSNIKKSKIHGKITCPPNKSYTHRAIFLAALSDGKSIVRNILRANGYDEDSINSLIESKIVFEQIRN